MNKDILPHTIAVDFGDNDYSFTVEKALEIVASGIILHKDYYRKHNIPIDKKRIKFLLDRALLCAYYIYRLPDRVNLDEELSIDDYLIVKEDRIFINEEVEEYINTHKDNFNYEFHGVTIWDDYGSITWSM